MELDVRPIPRARKHSTIFDTFIALGVGEHFILVNDHDPVPLRAQFNVNFARSFTWTYDESGPEIWRVRITKVASTPLPQVLANTGDLATTDSTPDMTGSIWRVPVADRGLDANVISLEPGTTIASHRGPDMDILFIVVAGEGLIGSEADTIGVTTGDVVWLPKGSIRQFSAGDQGLRYLTVHTRQLGLGITSL